MTLRERWIQVVHQAATSTRRTRSLLTPLGVMAFAAFTTIFVLGALLVDQLLGLPELLPAAAAIAVSLPVLAAGVAMTAWSGLHFLTVKGTPVPFNPPPTVVTTGPYRYVRNPMLTGVFLVLFGLGLLLSSMSLALVFTPLFVAANFWELKRIEEPELMIRLGDEYAQYRMRTPMFVPRCLSLRRSAWPPREPNR